MSADQRRICYVSGTRADFGLMQSTLQRIARHPALALSIAVTGMHLSAEHGETVREIAAAGLPVSARIPVELGDASGAAMARNIGAMLAGLVDAFLALKPDLVLLLGDRGEMLAGALAAIHLNVPVAHIHGGERSGTVDEPVRHAISKLSHIHFVATEQARARLIRMGEAAPQVLLTGAPGLDGLAQLAALPRADLCRESGFDPARPVALCVFHPVLQEAGRAGSDTAAILRALLAQRLQVLALQPNSDAGSAAVRAALAHQAAHPDVRVLTHLPRAAFVSWMAACDLMVGNSSSGIIEAATFGTPVLNIGVRQNLRERNANVRDLDVDGLPAGLAAALRHGRYAPGNCYGDGQAGARIAAHLAACALDAPLLLKANAY